jgi:hypothetical protein
LLTSVGDDVRESKSPEFYSKQAARLRKIAVVVNDLKAKQDLRELAEKFEKLAEFSKSTHDHPPKD